MMRRLSVLWIGLMVSVSAMGLVEVADTGDTYSVRYSNETLTAAIHEFASVAGLDVSCDRTETDNFRVDLDLADQQWEEILARLAEPNGFEIHQEVGGIDMGFSRLSPRLLRRDLPIRLELESRGRGPMPEEYREMVEFIGHDLRDKGFANLAGLFLALLFLAGLPCHWAARTMGFSDSSIRRGLFMAFLTILAGLPLFFVPNLFVGLLGIAIVLLLMQRVFGTTFLEAITLMILFLIYFVLLCALVLVALMGIWQLLGVF